MDHLESQVSDLESFLPGSVSSTVPPGGLLGPMVGGPPGPRGGREGNAHAAHALQPHGGGAGGGGRSTGTPSAYSALHGPNSAHAAPATVTPTTYSSAPIYTQQATQRAGPSNSRQGPGASPGAVDPGASASASASAGAKRRAEASAEEAAQKQQRSKRNRYISIACNECKRRKVKCNGETPCQRCGSLNLACLYAPNCCSNSFRDSDEFKQMTDSLSSLQHQMDTLQQKMAALQQETLRLAPLHDRVLPLPTATTSHAGPSPSTSTSSVHKPDIPSFRSPVQFRGPTSASAHVNVARNTLHNMGYSGADGSDDSGNIMTGDDTMAVSPPVASSLRDDPRRPADPLWDYDREEMIRLCRVHEEEVGIMYPVVNIEHVIAHAMFVRNFMDSARKHGLATPHLSGLGDGISDIKTLELKIIMCCALVVEEHGHSVRADRLWASIQPVTEKMMMSDPTDVTNMPFLALVGGYRFLANEEVLAWRFMGHVVRLCTEMGLHRRDGIARIEGEQDRKNAINAFWSAYVLDRRWSFGTGLPFAVADEQIDPGLPFPEGAPYLTSLILLAKLSAKIWRQVDYFDSVLIRDLKRNDFERLDREILEWYETVPDSIRTTTLGTHVPVPGTSTYNVERLQIWTRLRLNQIRIWLYTPVLHTATSITQNNDYAQLVVSLAKETIQYLSLLNTTSEIYRRIQVFYHHFLTSAIAVLFLASTHAPADFSSQCREHFHMALELVKELSEHSWVSQRLWTTVESLKAFAPRLGLQQDEDPQKRGHAALTMTGLAGTGHTQHASHRSSVSSGGHQPSPSPGVTPGRAGHQQHRPSRIGSLTPHGGRNSPRSASGMPNHGPRTSHGTNSSNGLRLQTEYSRLYEGFTNDGHRVAYNHGGAEGFYPGHMSDYSVGGSTDFAPDEEQTSVFPSFRSLF